MPNRKKGPSLTRGAQPCMTLRGRTMPTDSAHLRVPCLGGKNRRWGAGTIWAQKDAIARCWDPTNAAATSKMRDSLSFSSSTSTWTRAQSTRNQARLIPMMCRSLDPRIRRPQTLIRRSMCPAILWDRIGCWDVNNTYKVAIYWTTPTNKERSSWIIRAKRLLREYRLQVLHTKCGVLYNSRHQHMNL